MPPEPFVLNITPKIAEEIARLEATTGAEIDDHPWLVEALRRGAEEHAWVLAESRRLGRDRVYR